MKSKFVNWTIQVNKQCFAFSFTCFSKVYEASSQHSQQQSRGSLEDLGMCLSKSDSIK